MAPPWCSSSHLPRSLVDEWLGQDTGLLDLTTTMLGIQDVEAEATLVSRERIVACGVCEAAAVYEAAGATVTHAQREGAWLEPGAVLLRVRGPAGALHRAWRVAQTLAAIGSAVATETRRLVEEAKKANLRVIVAVARKAPPGLRGLYYRCVLAGGASLHRMGLGDTVLVFPQHYRLLPGGLEEALERLREARSLAGERRIVVETAARDEALLAAGSGVVDEIQLDHMEPRELARLAEEIRRLAPGVKIAVGGGITVDNVALYAPHVDVVVTSAPYWARPADLTTRITPLKPRSP